MKPTATVAVVSVTYNRWEPLLVLFRQIRELDYPSELISIFLVDNASTDDTVEHIRAEFPEVHLVLNPINSGVSAGFNRSIEEALGDPREHDYIWLLDSDAEVEPDTLTHLVEALERNEDIGIAGSAVYHPTERSRLVTAGFKVDWKKGDIPTFVPEGEDQQRLFDVDLIPACSLLIRSQICREVGPWDGRFPLYWGDTDWCARVLLAGHRIVCHESSRVWHREWASVQRGFGSPDFIRDHMRGALLFLLRYSDAGQREGVRHLLMRNHFYAAVEHLTMRADFSHAYIEAVDDVIHGSFWERDFARAAKFSPAELDEMLDSLAPRLGERPHVLLNQIGDAELTRRIKDAFERRFGEVRWEEIPRRLPNAEDWREIRCWRPDLIPELLHRLLAPHRRPDVNVCSVSTPLLYNLVAGKHTMMIDASGRGRVEENRILAGLGRFAATGIRGLRTIYFDLPRAERSCRALREAMADRHATGNAGAAS